MPTNFARGPDARVTTFWGSTARRWGVAHRVNEGAFIAPSGPWEWRADDPAFADDCERRDDEAQRRLAEALRQRALEGSDRALGLCLGGRSSARVADKGAATIEAQPLPPDVAAAMIAAGLAAFGEPEVNVPYPAIKSGGGLPRPPAPPALLPSTSPDGR